jgi:tetratricopeptide (TPR) repeat protein
VLTDNDRALRNAESLRASGDRAGALAAFAQVLALDPQHLSARVSVGNLLRELGRLDEAERVMRAAVDAVPDSVGARMGLGEILRARGDHLGAIDAFGAVLKANHEFIPALVSGGHTLCALGRGRESEEMLRRALRLKPEHPGALLALAELQRSRGERAAALEVYEKLIVVEPAHVAARVMTGNLLRELGRTADAEAHLRGALQLAPNHVGALIGLAEVLRARGDRAGALAQFEAVLRVEPRHISARVAAGDALREMGRLDDAEARLRDVLHDAPREVGALTALGELLWARRDRAGAVAAFQAAIAADPHHLSAQVAAGNALREMGRLAEAETLLRGVLIEAADHAGARLGLAQLLLDTERFDEAKTLVEAISANIASKIMLGHIARRRGDRKAALSWFGAALEQDASNTAARVHAAIELAEVGRLAEAHEVLDRTLASEPTHVLALMHKGYVLRQEGRRAEAAEAFSRVLAHHADEVQPMVELAIERRALGDPSDSARLLERVLDRDPVHREALMQCAANAFLAGDTETALRFCERAIKAHPYHVAAYLHASQAAAELGWCNRAHQYLEEAAASFGALPQITAKRVELRRRERDWAGARALLDAAGEESGRDFALWAERVELAIATADDDAAVAAFGAMPTLTFDEHARAAAFRAKYYEGRWRLVDALAAYEEAIALRPDVVDQHFATARVCLKLLDFDACRAHLAQSVRLNASMNIVRRLSQNLSQTHVGQLLDEFTLDGDVRAGLEALRSASPESRISPLLDMVCQNPDNTAPALALLAALRQSGRLEKIEQARGERRIPSRIMQFWHQDVPPADISTQMDRWRDSNRGYDCQVFHRLSAAAYLARYHGTEVQRAFGRIRDPVQSADIFRLAWLAREGGFYADVDTLPHAAVERFVPAGAELIAAQDEYGAVATNFLGAQPEHPIIVLALRLAVEEINRGDHDMVWLSTGPGLMTRALAQALAKHGLEILNQTTIVRWVLLQRHIAFWYPLAYKRARHRTFRAHSASVSEGRRLETSPPSTGIETAKGVAANLAGVTASR